MATVYWQGSDVPVPEQQTVTLALTWATGDTLELIINGKSLTLTVGSTATVTQIAADAVDMINGAAANGDETRSALGTSVGEWDIVTATSSAGVITVTGASDGRPIGTITATATTAGDGTATQAASVTAGSPGDAGSATNWSGGSLPVDTDVVVFDERAASGCKYNLDAINDVTPDSVSVTSGYRYQIGLPLVNRDSASLPFDEPNGTYLQFDGVTNEIRVEAANAQMIKIDSLTAVAAKFVVNSSGSTIETGTPPVLIKANNSSSVATVHSGTVGVNYGPAITGSLNEINANGGAVTIGDTTTLVTLNIAGATVDLSSTATTINLNSGSLIHRDGGATTVNMQGGQFDTMTDGTFTNVFHTGGIIDASKDSRGCTFSNYDIYPGATFKDPLNTTTLSDGINVHGSLKQVTLDVAPRKKYTISAIS